MVYKTTSVILESDMLKKAKELGINVSDICREALERAVGTNKLETFEGLIASLREREAEIIHTITVLEERKQELVKKDKEEDALVLKMYKDIPEVQNLTESFLNDSKAVNNLVTLLREKYPNIRSSVSGVRKYYELIKNEGS